MPAFVVVLLALFILGDIAWAAFVIGKLRLTGLRRTAFSRIGISLVTMFLLLAVGGLVAILSKRLTGFPENEPVVLPMLTLLWHLLVLPITFVVLLLMGVIQLPVRIARAMSRKKEAVSVPAPAPETVPLLPSLSRRRLLAITAAGAPPLATLATIGVSLRSFRAFQTRDVTLTLPNLPPQLEGLTIAHLSDTHLGEFSDLATYRRAIDATNALRADLIVHTGDVINHDSDDLPDAMAGLAKLDAPLGVFVCEGNHDLIQDPRRFRQEILKLTNLRFLRNNGATIDARGIPLQILGARWATPADAKTESSGGIVADPAIATACEDLKLAVDPAARFRIALAHHPHGFDYLPFADLTLSGHTHGGQLQLSQNLGFGPMMYRYWSGAYRSANRSLFVSNGAGNWFPLRVNAPAEILRLTLRRA